MDLVVFERDILDVVIFRGVVSVRDEFVVSAVHFGTSGKDASAGEAEDGGNATKPVRWYGRSRRHGRHGRYGRAAATEKQLERGEENVRRRL